MMLRLFPAPYLGQTDAFSIRRHFERENKSSRDDGASLSRVVLFTTLLLLMTISSFHGVDSPLFAYHRESS